ncbi:DUF4811 domain-containing protein [Enterococcus sp. 669A]|uniref:DUF4811 domain-containing protein n=1 Tax=Candidatus Enterococcus moelleringii TaxID=2815325 RepID=A0ABS3L9M8_9ENTE|nr:DUF4811 domain-containing protein [Enterococcus sp. 669A]MBO1306343.1 DUF4811 domain-containing protein [Enterococcus sp. 669A]
MIFVVTILSVLAFALTNIFAKKHWQTGLSVLFAAIFLVSLGFITANDHYHYGMKKVTETTVKPLVSSADGQQGNMLLYQPLGNGTEKVYLYKTTKDQKKPKATGTDLVANHLKTNQKKAQLIEKITYWTYKNDTAKRWFNLTSKDHELVKEDNTFEVSDDWFVLTTDQAKKLAKLAADNQSAMAEQAKAFVQEKVGQAMTQNPSLDQAAQQQIAKQATADYQKEAMTKLIAEVTQ